MFRKVIAAVSVLTLASSGLAGCSASTAKDDGKLNIVCTIFPIYDWTKQIVGDSPDVELTYLLDNGADLHNYQPTADDMITISDCDVFIYVGGESDKWVDNTLSEARNKDMVVIDLMDILGESSLHEEELKEGMEAEEEEEEGEDEGPEYDEHIWLSLKNAVKCVEAIDSKLETADSENSAAYQNNTKAYTEKLNSLDKDFTDMTSSAKNKTLIFGDRFPFRYLIDDYGLDYYAAFIGCSSESEASFETITFLAKKCDELGAEYVFTIDESNCNIADAVIANTQSKSQEILTLYSMQNVKITDNKQPAGYCDLMAKNLKILEKALK